MGYFLNFQSDAHYKTHLEGDFVDPKYTMSVLKSLNPSDNPNGFDPEILSLPSNFRAAKTFHKVYLFPELELGYNGIIGTDRKSNVEWKYRLERGMPSKVVVADNNEERGLVKGVTLILAPNISAGQLIDVITFYPGNGMETPREPASFYRAWMAQLSERGEKGVTSRMREMVGESFEFWGRNALIQTRTQLEGSIMSSRVKRGLTARLRDGNLDAFFELIKQEGLINN